VKIPSCVDLLAYVVFALRQTFSHHIHHISHSSTRLNNSLLLSTVNHHPYLSSTMSHNNKKCTHTQMATSHDNPQDHSGSNQERNMPAHDHSDQAQSTDTHQPAALATPIDSDLAGHSHVASSAPGSAPGTLPSRGPEFAQGAVRAEESTMDVVQAVNEEGEADEDMGDDVTTGADQDETAAVDEESREGEEDAGDASASDIRESGSSAGEEENGDEDAEDQEVDEDEEMGEEDEEDDDEEEEEEEEVDPNDVSTYLPAFPAPNHAAAASDRSS
jgi:hypothetical protein